MVICLIIPLANAEWVLVFSDHFNHNGGIDEQKWRFDTGTGENGWGNWEEQYYTSNKENVRCELFPGSNNGRLIVEARRQKYGNKAYTSARIVSKGAWTYGRWQIRAKVPGSRGLWSAFWMLPQKQTYGRKWPDSGEINIMEHVGYDPQGIHASVHTKAHNHLLNSHPTNRVTVSDAVNSFKIYTLDWQPHRLSMFVGDDADPLTTRVLFWNKQDDWTKWPFDQPFHLIMNLAVGGNWGGKKGVDNRAFPAQLEIDWVKYYQQH